MLRLHIGFDNKIEVPKKGGCLYLAEEVPELPNWRRAKVFDWREHSFDILEGMDYPKAVAFVDALLGLMPGGEATLTKEDAEYVLLEALMSSPRSLETLIPESKDPVREKARRMVGRFLLSPVLRRVFCNPTNFSFKKGSVVFVRLNGAELVDFDRHAIGWMLMAYFGGQIIVEDFGFYGRDAHVRFKREKRLVAGIRKFSEVSKDLQDELLSIPDKVASRVLYGDAVKLAEEAGLRPDPLREDNPYNRFIDEAMTG
jgi:hypothetical protein